MIKRVLWKIKAYLGCKVFGRHKWERRGFTSLNYKGVNVISGELTQPELLDHCMFCGKEK